MADMDAELERQGESGDEHLGMDDSMDEIDGDGHDADFLVELSPDVKKRVHALKKLQVEVTNLEAEFYKELHALEQKYLPLYQPFFEKRNLITSGEYEPTEEECNFPGIEEVTQQIESMKVDKEEKDSGDKPVEEKGKIIGIPEFWLKIFANVDLLADMMEEHDIPILKHLTDIKVESSINPMGFKLHFHFSPNEYFTNSVLTKTYLMKCEVDPDEPFTFEGPEIIKSTGCPIEWNKGKNVTVKIVKKKQKHKQRGSIRTINKTVTAPSFFNFFSPPEIPENSAEELDDELQLRLTNDFEVGQYIRERIVPHAVLFYTGEALDDEEEFEDDDSDEEEEEDDDDDDNADEEDEDEAKPNVNRHGGGAETGGPKGRRKANKSANQQECKQQ